MEWDADPKFLAPLAVPDSGVFPVQVFQFFVTQEIWELLSYTSSTALIGSKKHFTPLKQLMLIQQRKRCKRQGSRH